MYTTTPSRTEDKDQIRDLVIRPTIWLRNVGFRGPLPDISLAGPLAGTQDDEGSFAWVCRDEHGVLRGVTALMSTMPDGSWHAAELTQRALLMTGTWTDPECCSERLGALMAWWALGYAADQGATWLRRTTTSGRLAENFQRQGWTLQRTLYTGRIQQHLLTRHAKPVDGLQVLITGPGRTQAAPDSSRTPQPSLPAQIPPAAGSSALPPNHLPVQQLRRAVYAHRGQHRPYLPALCRLARFTCLPRVPEPRPHRPRPPPCPRQRLLNNVAPAKRTPTDWQP